MYLFKKISGMISISLKLSTLKPRYSEQVCQTLFVHYIKQFTISNIKCLVNPQNGSWVLFTISQNSLYRGSLYQGLSVVLQNTYNTGRWIWRPKNLKKRLKLEIFWGAKLGFLDWTTLLFCLYTRLRFCPLIFNGILCFFNTFWPFGWIGALIFRECRTEALVFRADVGIFGCEWWFG